MFSRKIVGSLFATALFLGATSSPAQAQQNNQGALGNLIAALVNVQAGDDLVVVDLSEVLRNADIRILNNVLNNALNNNNVEIEVLNDVTIQDLIDGGVLTIQDVIDGGINIPIDVELDNVVVGVNVLGGQFVLFP